MKHKPSSLLSVQGHLNYRLANEEAARRAKEWFDQLAAKHRPKPPKRLPGLPYGPERSDIEQEMAERDQGLRVELSADKLTVTVHYTLDSSDGLTIANIQDSKAVENMLWRKYGIPNTGTLRMGKR